MSDTGEKQPLLIPPLVRTSDALELMRERAAARRGATEHPHCEEHFLFTPHCAACIEAERTGYATASAIPMEQPSTHKAHPSPARSSRSFGFTDNIPPALTDEPPLAQRLAYQNAYDTNSTIAGDLINILLDI